METRCGDDRERILNMPMIPPSRAGDFKPCPAGLQQLVCVDICDLGMMTSSYNGDPKTQHKIAIKWQSIKRMADDKPYLVQKRYTYSLHKKSTLRADLQSWRGRAMTDAECDVFDLEKLIGVNAYGNILHVTRDDATYANIAALMPLPREIPRLVARDYVRIIDREENPAPKQVARPVVVPVVPPPPVDEWGVEPDNTPMPSENADFPADSPALRGPDDDIPF
jgi:hypothetical protein